MIGSEESLVGRDTTIMRGYHLYFTGEELKHGVV